MKFSHDIPALNKRVDISRPFAPLRMLTLPKMNFMRELHCKPLIFNKSEVYEEVKVNSFLFV
jgi:hypothetical protein